MSEGQRQDRAPEAVERFVKQLLVAHKAARLYPSASGIPQESANDLLRMLRELLRDQSELRFQVTKDGLVYEGAPVLPGLPAFDHFAREFYHRNLTEVRFHGSATAREVVSFLHVLQEPPELVTATGGFEQRLWDMQVDGITVRLVTAKIVDPDLETDTLPPDEDWPPTRERVDELLDAGLERRPKDHRLLVRFLRAPQLVGRYLKEVVDEPRASGPVANAVAGKVVSLAHVATIELAEDQPELLRSIAESLLSLDAGIRRDVLTEKLLPESRLDDSVASVMRHFELRELCDALVEGLGDDPVSRDGLARAIRNIATISVQPKEDVIQAAAESMRDVGMAPAAVMEVLDGAAPSQLKVAAPAAERRSDALENILRLVDLAPVAGETLDEEVLDLKDEVADGITDGDIFVSIVTLLSVGRRSETFARLMGMVEDGVSLLLEWNEFADAAAAASGLKMLENDESLDPAERQRVRDALETMATPKHMRDVGAAMRLYPAGSPEQEACRELITTLGGTTIAPLLEVLASEPDMSARRTLIEVIAGLATEHVAELGAFASDPRWYFVRNVVSLLGSTRDPAALQYLNRTLRHADTRVRRETIRALASIHDRLADEMLAAALGDDDAQNVSLAARYLGSLGSKNAAGALAAVARGDGRGNRDLSCRIEAIEALGHIGTPQAEAVIAEVARQRSRLRGGRTRELQTAAEAALANIKQRRERGGA